ncbi:MAG: glycosyltransferase family 2 protein [Bacteroidia bacterium]
MFVSGFSFIRNATKLDYPICEAIRSILPLLDEMVVAVGKSEDNTRELIQSLGPKIRIVDTTWDDSLRKGGEVLAVETNKALDAVNPNSSWCIYIQGDECIHEQYHENVRAAMQEFAGDAKVEGLLFNYLHFYGSYDYIGDSRTWYRKEVRIIKNLKGIRSYRDAQGFRLDNRKLRVKKVDAYVYHYGWVRHPKHQMAKQLEAHKLWHTDNAIKKKFDANQDFDYSEIDSIKPFEGTHPEVMIERIQNMNWTFDRDPKVKKFSLKNSILYFIEKNTGYRVGEYKNYKLV